MKDSERERRGERSRSEIEISAYSGSHVCSARLLGVSTTEGGELGPGAAGGVGDGGGHENKSLKWKPRTNPGN